MKEEALRICGERDDGNSPFDTQVVRFLDDAYQGLLAGGNLFGVDIAEPWAWAESERPIVLELKPYVTGSATMTNASRSGTFSVAPSISLEGRHLAFAGKDDIYVITQHTAASTSFQIDHPFILDSGSYTYNAYKLDYEAQDDTIVIESSKNKLDFNTNGSDYTATITAGSYTPTTLGTEIDTRILAASSVASTTSFDSITRKFTIAQGGASSFGLNFATGTNVNYSISEILGYDCLDYSGALTYTSVYALSGILRITKPITTNREAPIYGQAAKEAGKIFYVDANTLTREYPLSRLQEAVPSRFAVIEQRRDGLWKLRMSASLSDEPARAELHYIPITRSLQNNDASIPKVPPPYTKFLVWAASYYLLLEKSDNRAAQYLQMAQAQLRALVNDSKKALSLGGNNFGRIIPRASKRNRYFGFRT